MNMRLVPVQRMEDNYSLSFDGNDDFVELMNIPSGLSSFSYVGWYKKMGQMVRATDNEHTKWHSYFFRKRRVIERYRLSK